MCIDRVLPEMFATGILNPGLVEYKKSFSMPVDGAGKSKIRLMFPNHQLKIDGEGRPLIPGYSQETFGDVALEYHLGLPLGSVEFKAMVGEFNSVDGVPFLVMGDFDLGDHSVGLRFTGVEAAQHLVLTICWSSERSRPANFLSSLPRRKSTMPYDVIMHEHIKIGSSIHLQQPTLDPSVPPEMDILVLKRSPETEIYFKALAKRYQDDVSAGVAFWNRYQKRKSEGRRRVEREIIAHLRDDIHYELREDDYLVWIPDDKGNDQTVHWLRYNPESVMLDCVVLRVAGALI